MRFVARFAKFWYDFIVGDDWRVAAGVVAMIAVVFAAAHHDVNAWWLLPLAAMVQLGMSVALEARRHSREPTTSNIEHGETT